MFDLNAAKKHVLVQVLGYDAQEPAENRPQIIDSATLERPFGWVFAYSNEAYLATGDAKYRKAGPGPVLFNRHTGEVRRFNATYEMAKVAEDYEKELEAGSGCWALFINSSDAKQLAMQLKGIFGMSGAEALKHSKNIPGPIFKGEWRTLAEFAPLIPQSTVQVIHSPGADLPELEAIGRGKWKIQSAR